MKCIEREQIVIDEMPKTAGIDYVR